MPGLLGVNPVPQPMDLSASTAVHHAASSLYLAVAVVLPLMTLVLVGLRAASARSRWSRWSFPDSVDWARRMPYELFVFVVPALAAVLAERLAVIALSSGVNRTAADNRLICITLAMLVAMGVSAARSWAPRRSPATRSRIETSGSG